ncbi:MAG: IPT/TIG domain-containing protein [Candidatus Acidiferrales bacterium]
MLQQIAGQKTIYWLDAPGQSVTITGTNLGATQGNSTVIFGGMPPGFTGTTATPTSWRVTSKVVTTIVVPVPSGATTGSILVTVSGVPTVSGTFTVTSQ